MKRKSPVQLLTTDDQLDVKCNSSALLFARVKLENVHVV